MDSQTFEKLLKLRRTLSAIGEINFAFFNFNKRYPLSSISSNTQADAISETYEDYIDEIKETIKGYEDDLPSK